MTDTQEQEGKTARIILAVVLFVIGAFALVLFILAATTIVTDSWGISTPLYLVWLIILAGIGIGFIVQGLRIGRRSDHRTKLK